MELERGPARDLFPRLGMKCPAAYSTMDEPSNETSPNQTTCTTSPKSTQQMFYCLIVLLHLPELRDLATIANFTKESAKNTSAVRSSLCGLHLAPRCKPLTNPHCQPSGRPCVPMACVVGAGLSANSWDGADESLLETNPPQNVRVNVKASCKTKGVCFIMTS